MDSKDKEENQDSRTISREQLHEGDLSVRIKYERKKNETLRID